MTVKRKKGRSKTRTILTLTISVKAMANDVLTTIILKPREIEAQQLRQDHSGLLFT